MKKLIQKIKQFRNVISVKTYKQPMLFVILMMVGINVLILFIAAAIAFIIDDNYTSLLDAFANGSLKWMLTPNAILLIDEPQTLFLAVIVLVIGLVLFSGTIIALTTNQIKEYFQKKKSGSGKIYLDDHIVILNWNNKVPELVADLLHIEEAEITVMILADVDKNLAEKQIINSIKKQPNHKTELQNLNVLVKQGDPLLQTDLVDISIENAKTIIIMNKDMYQTVTKDMTKSDLNVIKTVLSVGRISFQHNPPIVAEVKRIESKQKIETMAKIVTTLENHDVLPICFDRRLGQIIAQTIIHHFMEDVYLSLFSFEGSEVYRLHKTSFDTCLQYHTDAVPLARKQDDLFVLSKDDASIHNKTKKPTSVVPLKRKEFNEATNLEVYIIGKNNKLEFILASFYEYEKLYHTDFQAKWLQLEEVEEFVEDLNKTTNPVTILLLSDEEQTSDSLDANVLDLLIYLEGNIKREDVNIIVEILDPQNDQIMRDFNIDKSIISNRIISLLISKLALFENTASFYENLLTLEINDEEEDDQEVIIRNASMIIDHSFPITFETKKSFVISLYEMLEKRMIPFGVIKQGELLIISDELHKEELFTIQKDDSIVLMKL